MTPIWSKARASTPPISCLGGWCNIRNRCELHLANDRRQPVERLCRRGADGVVDDVFEEVVDDYPVVRIHRAAGSWERFGLLSSLFLPATPFDALQVVA